MQRSSNSIGSLAAALAKAQAVLVNPDKSLVGTILADRIGGAERFFRYASLATGLDIVRKTLGDHEMATVQTTAIDQAAGIVKLTTLLAHSSGEWISSDWPVCAIGDMATPRRMGAALTYARRYALFTLVGIAGEDDLDAPDLHAPDRGAPQRAAGNASDTSGADVGRRAGGNAKTKVGPKPGLEPGASAEVRDRLLAGIAEIGSDDEAALWAYSNMRAKNGLTAADAHRVEHAFETQLASLGKPTESVASERRRSVEDVHLVACAVAEPSGEITTPLLPAGAPDSEPPNPGMPPFTAKRRKAGRVKPRRTIDKAVLMFPEPRRIRDREHVRLVAKQPCLVCGRVPCDSHHLRFTQSRALGRKVSDEFTVPLCRGHHREIHRCGDEAAWWRRVKIDPTIAARALWLKHHPLSAFEDVVTNRSLRASRNKRIEQ